MTEAASEPASAPSHAPPSATKPPVKDEILARLRECYDPEIPVNIVDLGLIYLLEISPEGRVTINMTLTAVGCPVAGWMQEQVRDRVASMDGVSSADVNVVFEPPWDTSKVTPEGREQLLAMGFPV